MKKPIFLLIIILSLQDAFCQSKPIGNWIAYQGNQNINNRWNLHNEIQLRNYNLIGDVNQFLIRMGIGYNSLNQRNNWLLGYAYFNTYTYDDGNNEKNKTKENRIFQQFIHRWKSNRFMFANRNRLEERLINNDMTFRWRSQFSAIIPLNQQQLRKGTYYGISSNEIFFVNRKNIFDRNRLYVGVGYSYNDFIRFEAGYMYQSMLDTYQQQFQLIVINTLPFSAYSKKRPS